MDENKSRPADNAAQVMSSSSWVKATNKDETSIHTGTDLPPQREPLRENFLQQITGASTRGSGAVTYEPSSRPSPMASSQKGPVPAGDVALLAKAHEDRWSAEYDLPSLANMPALWSGGSLAELESHPTSSAVIHDAKSLRSVAKDSGSEHLHPSRNSEDLLSKYRRVVYPPSEGEKTDTMQTGVSRTASYPQLPVIRKQTSTLPPLPLQKSPLFDSITQLDVEISTTNADPIPPYISTAMHKTAKESRKDARAVVQPHQSNDSRPQYNTARSIHFESPSVEVAAVAGHAQRLSPLYRPIRSSVELTSRLSLQAATSGSYHATSGSHFMYRPRIPSVRWVKIETPSDRLAELTEQLHELAPWIVGAIFLLAISLGVFILLSI